MRTLTSTELQQTNGAVRFDLTFDNLKDRVIEPGLAGAAFGAVYGYAMHSAINRKMMLAYTVATIVAYNVYDLVNS